MEDVKRILVVNSMTKSSKKAIHYGGSLSKKMVPILLLPFDPGERCLNLLGEIWQ